MSPRGGKPSRSSATPRQTDDLLRLLEGPLFGSAPIGMVLATPDGRVVAVNPHATEIVKALSEGTNLGSVFSNHQEAVAGMLEATEGPVGPFTMEASGPTGGRYIEATATAVEGSDGRRLLVLLNDVTARVQAEREVESTRDSLMFQKSLLESQSEALVDGVLVVGRGGEMISFNHRFVEMWGIPDDVVASRSDEAAIGSVLNKLKDPLQFQQKIAYLYDHPTEKSLDELEMIDGRTIERFSAPVIGEEGRLFGRMWFFRDITENKRRERTLELLASAAEAAAATRDVVHNMQAIGRLVVQEIADTCLIYLIDDEGLVDRVELSDRDPELEAYLREAVRPFQIDPHKPAGVSKVLQDGRPILEPHATAEMMAADVTNPEELLKIIGKIGIESWICVPLLAHHEIIGAMSLVSVNPRRRFTDSDLDLAMELSRRVSLGIRSVRIGERESAIAETLQRSLLPQTLPQIPGLLASSHYVAGSTGMDVGGDWFEMIELPGKKVLAVIGDVAGKGVRAAAVMGEIRMALRAYAMESSSPSDLVNRLNRLLMEGDDDYQMATVLCAVIDLRQYTVSFVTAGHPPPLMLDPSGRARFLEGGLHPPLGMPLHMLQEAEHGLPPGSTLLLYTDGAVERRDRHIDEGMEAMRALVEAAASDPSTLCARVVASVVDGQAPTDDVAVLCLQLPAAVAERLDLTASADPRELKSIRAAVERWLVSHEIAPELTDDIVLAVNEASANAIEHAYGPGHGRFSITGRRDGEVVVIDVTDRGRWREAAASEQGRGISLMRSLMDEVSIEAGDGGTVVTMRKAIDGATVEAAPGSAPPSATRESSVARVSLSGELDLARSKALTKSLLDQVTNDMTGLVLDLSDVTYIDSSGLRMLFVLQKRLEQRRQGFTAIVPEDSPLRRMLDLGGVASAVTIATSA